MHNYYSTIKNELIHQICFYKAQIQTYFVRKYQQVHVYRVEIKNDILGNAILLLPYSCQIKQH